jgi:transcriptional regulator GlxA family with amidase domain
MLTSTRYVFALARNVSLASRCSFSTGTSSLSRPLSIFVCAADEASDSAGAALVASLKQLHKQGVQLYGVVRASVIPATLPCKG